MLFVGSGIGSGEEVERPTSLPIPASNDRHEDGLEYLVKLLGQVKPEHLPDFACMVNMSLMAPGAFTSIADFDALLSTEETVISQTQLWKNLAARVNRSEGFISITIGDHCPLVLKSGSPSEMMLAGAFAARLSTVSEKRYSLTGVRSPGTVVPAFEPPRLHQMTSSWTPADVESVGEYDVIDLTTVRGNNGDPVTPEGCVALARNLRNSFSKRNTLITYERTPHPYSTGRYLLLGTVLPSDHGVVAEKMYASMFNIVEQYEDSVFSQQSTYSTTIVTPGPTAGLFSGVFQAPTGDPGDDHAGCLDLVLDFQRKHNPSDAASVYPDAACNKGTWSKGFARKMSSAVTSHQGKPFLDYYKHCRNMREIAAMPPDLIERVIAFNISNKNQVAVQADPPHLIASL